MKTAYSRSEQVNIPRYKENGALQLIVASGVTFIFFHFTRVIMLHVGMDKDEVVRIMFPNIGLSTETYMAGKFWTILTYGWVHHGFFDWFTNMIWMYCFGSVLQNMAGYKQLIPLFTGSMIVGGGFYAAARMIAPEVFASGAVFLGAQAGVLALGVAAFTLNPRYRLHISPGFTIPLSLVLGIYVVLDLVLYIPAQWNAVALCLGGALAGVGYASLLKAGYQPAERIYRTLGRIQNIATPDEAALHEKRSAKRMEIMRNMYEPKQGISQQVIDDILDKINEQGYHALTKEEKNILLRAARDND